MSRTKDAIMDIIDRYGYIPKGYTFTDYHKEFKNEERVKTSKREETDHQSNGGSEDHQQTQEEQNN